MPNNTNERRGKQAGELSAEERFRNFFSTSVIDLPEEMTRRDEPAPVEEKPKAGLLGKLFSHDKEQAPAPAQPVLEIPTGEILLGADAKPVQPEQEDMALELRTADPVPAMPMQPASPEPAKAVPAEPVPAPKAAAAVQPEPEKPAPQPVPQPVAAPQKQPKAKNAPETLLPQEELEQREMQQLKDMLNGMSGKAKPAPQPAKPVQVAPQPKVQPAPAQPAAEPEKAPAKAAQNAAEELPPVVFASAPADPETLPKKPEKKSIFQMFGTAEDEKPAARKPEKEDTMSLPLLPLEQDDAPAEPAPAPADAAPAAPAQPETAPEAAVPTEEAVPESIADKLHHMAAELTLRCVLAGILAVVLLHLGLTAERLLPPLSVLDPDAAPAAFYAANLLLFAASLFVGYPVLRDGLTGLRGRPSADTMPALAAVAALLQAVVAMLNANAYRSTEGIGLLTGMAALGLFLALVGSRVMLSAVQGGYALAAEGGELRGAYRTRDKDLIRALARDLEQKDPWVLLSRPVQTASDDFVEQSLSERASERRARKVACVLLAAAVLSGVAFLLFGGGINCAVAAAAAVLCMGAPLSSVLVPGLAALRLQRAAAAVGAVVPGWAAIEELGGIDTIELDADDLFTADSVTLEDIRIFKGGRIDRAILYAASVLNESCDTLRGLFRQIIEDRTDILFPVKDLEQHHGLGFSAWCDNNRILIGTRRYLEQEGVPLPDEEYEMQHSKNGELQILYLAVSGNLHAMFVLKYVGGRNVARGLAVLQKENIRLLVTCQDPSLTAHHITEAYRLPEGMITVLDQEQCNAIKAAPEDPEDTCCMIHLKAFASLTGGLQAADQAQNAESSATTVQMVSVLFSIIIAALLTSAGSIWELSVATVLMYQAAWSALSIAVCALKQHN